MNDVPMELDPRRECCPLCGGEIRSWGAKSRGVYAYKYDRCCDCDFAFVNPRPTQAALERYYASSENSNGKAQLVPIDRHDDPGEWARTAISEMLATRAGPGRFLDVGAGGGAFTLAALQAGLKPTALELDADDAIRLRSLRDVEVVVTPLERFDAMPGSFEYIFMSHVLEHAHDPLLWVAKASQLLSPGGVLAICLPHFDSIYRLLGGTMDRYFFPPEHLNHFNTKSLERLCNRHGLTKDRAYSLGRFPDDVVSRRLRLPGPIARAVRVATAGAGYTIEKLTRATGTGAVLFLVARKTASSPAPSAQVP